jgi:hypothetical protein
MTNDESLKEYNSLIKNFIQNGARDDLDHLCELVEHVRGQGILYQDFPEKNATLLELLLRTSLDLMKSPLIYSSDKPWWFIREVYDIIFHQVRLGEYPSICAELYFQLSKDVLDEKFHKFYERNSTVPSYGMCVYFIQMADGWFADREKEFLIVFQKMKPLFGEEPDHLEEPWLNRYQKLNINNN